MFQCCLIIYKEQSKKIFMLSIINLNFYNNCGLSCNICSYNLKEKKYLKKNLKLLLNLFYLQVYYLLDLNLNQTKIDLLLEECNSL